MKLTQIDIINLISNVSYVIFLILCMIYDYKFRRIPNKITLTYLVFLAFTNSIMIHLLLDSLTEKTALILGLFVIYRLRIIGGGDFKVYLVSIFVLDPQTLLVSIVLSLTISAIMIEVKKYKCIDTPNNTKMERNPPLITIFGLILFGVCLSKILI